MAHVVSCVYCRWGFAVASPTPESEALKVIHYHKHLEQLWADLESLLDDAANEG